MDINGHNEESYSHDTALIKASAAGITWHILEYYLGYLAKLNIWIMLFAHLGQEEMVEFLIEHNADVNLSNAVKKSALHFAVANGK